MPSPGRVTDAFEWFLASEQLTEYQIAAFDFDSSTTRGSPRHVLSTQVIRKAQGGAGALFLCPGRSVIEVIPRHVSKGAALEALMSLPAFKGRRPVMINTVGPHACLTACCRKR